jgi:hypothetical protein
MKRIHICSNCQTEGLAEALTVILSDDRISQSQISPLATDRGYLTPILEDGIDVLVTSDNRYWGAELKEEFPALQVVRVPKIVFPAFHPDIIYAVDSEQRRIQCLNADYHSALCLWGWKNGLSPEHTIVLFSERTFYELGYLHTWDSSCLALQTRFKEARLDFSTFWRKVKRLGAFMYSSNHPKVEVICEVAKQIAVKLGAAESIYDEPIQDLLTETLDAIRWPIYPPIAHQLGLKGSFQWKIRKDKFLSLEQYVHSAFDSYERTLRGRDEAFFHSDGYEEFNKTLQKLSSKAA